MIRCRTIASPATTHTVQTSRTTSIKRFPRLCFDCHDNFLKDAKFKHDPAANGDCLSCHDPHVSETDALLIKPGAQLCFQCHDPGDMKNVKTHQKFPKRDCISCHDPHAGSDEHFLKSGIAKLVSGPGTNTPSKH